MVENHPLSKAEQAAQEALCKIYTCIEEQKSFLLEAGAGAGKTYSLIKALKYLIDRRGSELLRRHQQIACITYTNVARDEIEARTDGHPVIFSSTIHAFCWSMIKDFQPFLRDRISHIDQFSKKIEEAGGIKAQKIDYDLGYRTVDEKCISLGHDDVLSLAVELMKESKFRYLLTTRYPILFIDEYQDTDKKFADALVDFFIGKDESPLIGFFGDHWQKIYPEGCGKIEHPGLEIIGKRANFRSASAVVEVLNRIRPDLPQEVKDHEVDGSVGVYHTNGWVGERRTDSHWKGDLSQEANHKEIEFIREYLTTEGWDFDSPGTTKILMLTHNALAEEQGYKSIAKLFSSRKELYLKKEDPYIAFLVDTIEPMCTAYENGRFGEMFTILRRRIPIIHSHADKKMWSDSMAKLLELRKTSNVGAVIAHLIDTQCPRVPDKVNDKERELSLLSSEEIDSSDRLQRIHSLKEIPYQEIISLTQFLNNHTLYSTKHGVKGAEFENVLVILGRGWNLYNFNQMLETEELGLPTDKNKREAFERNRNLFYVACSRPKKRLALLFTQELSADAMVTLTKWFGKNAIHSMC
jgi:DNA helicase II / ATP-dependent DNA helicase PcrA